MMQAFHTTQKKAVDDEVPMPCEQEKLELDSMLRNGFGFGDARRDSISSPTELPNINHCDGTRGHGQEKLELLSLLVNGFCGGSSNPSNGVSATEAFAMHPTSGGTLMTMKRRQNELTADVLFPATSVRESYSVSDIERVLLQGTDTNNEFLGADPSFVDFVWGGFIEDDLDHDLKVYNNKKRKVLNY